jgi:ribosome maturation protein Sdo1
MPAFEQKRDQMIEHLVAALALADEINDTATGYLIERALDEARAAIVPSPAEAQRQ